MGYADDIRNRLNNVKPVENRIPFIGEGNSDLVLEYIETYIDKKLGESIEQLGFSARAVFTVEASQSHTPGTKVTKIWNLFKPSKFPNQANDADRFVDFICKLQGCKIGEHGAAMNALINKQADGGQLEAQLARGMRIKVTGIRANKPTINPTTGAQTWFVNTEWATYTDQDQAKIAGTRALLDQQSPYVPRQQMQQAPVQQMQQAPMQYAPQPMQAYPQQPLQQAPMQLQQYPQQSAQPMQVQPAQQPQPVQGAPAGGFLSLLPQR